MIGTSLKSGDMVQILTPKEISETLDKNGTLENLPFMPEMLEYCGKKYKVKIKIEKTCVACINSEGTSSDKRKSFIYNNVVFLENLRCSGITHDFCKTGCMIFWKESWLKKVPSTAPNVEINYNDVYELKSKLETKLNNKYFCQSTQLNLITSNISLIEKFKKLCKEIIRGDISFVKATKSIIYPIMRKLIYERLITGIQRQTPEEVLNLQPGENIEIKSFEEILKTLDKFGRNKGLRFYHDMKKYCGKEFKVRNRLDRMINEVTGEMVEIKNTVILDDATCSYEYAFMGCPRARFHFWREIWLKRSNYY